MIAARRLAFAAFVAACVVLVYWAFAWSSVQVLLAADADARETAWSRGGTPWQWAFDRRDTVVWPGSTGFERAQAFVPVLGGDIPDGNADLSLNLHGEAVDLSLVSGASLWVETKTPLRATLLVGDEPSQAFAFAQVHPPGGVVTMRAADTLTRHARVLRLHIEAAPGSRIGLHVLGLTPRRDLEITDCSDAARCAAALARLRAPGFTFPEGLLHWRDARMLSHPATIIEPRSAPAMQFASDVREAATGPMAWLLGLTPLFVAIVSRLRRAPAGRGTAALELALVFAPWLLLQWAGWPSDDTPEAPNWIFAGALAGAALLRGDVWRWSGDATAWKAAGLLALVAVVPIASVALANALDGDGFTPRALAADKAWQYPLWALLQQWILLRAIAPRTRLASGSTWLGALSAGAIFGLLHAPNFALMIATFAAGTAWAALGYRHRALLPLVAVHVLTGLALLWAAPPWLLRSAEIGGRYLMAP